MPKEGKRHRNSEKSQVQTLTERVKSLERSLALSKAETHHNSRYTYDDYSHSSPQKCVDGRLSVGAPSPPNAILSSDDLFSTGTDMPSLPSDGSDNEQFTMDFFGAESFDPNTNYDLVPSVPNDIPSTSKPPLNSSFSQMHSFDRLPGNVHSKLDSGRPPKTANSYSSNSFDAATSGVLPIKMQNPAQRPYSDVSEAVVDYLLDLYFRRFQILMEIVPEKDFMEQMRLGSGPAYRESLLFAMLAAGYRYSSKTEATAPYTLPNNDSGFVQRATRLLESELQDCNITTVQTLLILGELHTSAGNDMTGCSLAAMASKLIFNLGLDLGNCGNDNLSETEIRIRHWILWCASVQDKYWALALGRPLSIKNQELQISRLAAKFARSSSISSSTIRPEEQVHESVLDLMELARDVTDSLYGDVKFLITLSGYATMSRLDTRLKQWFASLPQAVKTGPAADKNPLMFIFVLHMQFHSTRILLQQRFAFPTSAERAIDEASTHPILPHTSDNARSVCAMSAIRVAKLFETFRRKYDVRSIQCTGTQYAAFAAKALVKHISTLPPDEVIEPVAHLQSLSRTLQDMSKTFVPAMKPLETINQELRKFSQNIEWFDHEDCFSKPPPKRRPHPHTQNLSQSFERKPAELIQSWDRPSLDAEKRLSFTAPGDTSTVAEGRIAVVSPTSFAANVAEWASMTLIESNDWNDVNDSFPKGAPTGGQSIFGSPERDRNASLDGWEELFGVS